MKYVTKILSLCLASIICVTNIHAQISILQEAVDEIVNSKDFSYNESAVMKTNYNTDTTKWKCNSVCVKESVDTNFGYFFKVVYDKQSQTVTYNGQNVIFLNAKDSSYMFIEPNRFAFMNMLPGHIKQLSDDRERNPLKVTQEKDTVINSVLCYHFIDKEQDDVFNREHSYKYIHFYINKQQGKIISIVDESRFIAMPARTVMTNYAKYDYSDYKFNQNNIDISRTEIPVNYHQSKHDQSSSSLKIGTVAPDWNLYSTDEKKLSLSKQKGEVVLIDFSFVGCAPCFEAIKPMNSLHERYKNKNVKIISIFPLDNKKRVIQYIKDNGIKFPIYISLKDVPTQYKVSGYPTFYFIDKEGKIANVFSGYSEDFETKTSSIIDSLLNKN